MKAILLRISRLVDIVSIPFVAISAVVLLAYREYGAKRLPLASRMLRSIGVFPIRDHYYEPLFNPKHLWKSLRDPRDLPGLDLRLDAQCELLSQYRYEDEFTALLKGVPDIGVEPFAFGNGSFESGDAELLYQFLRHAKPGKVVEIGSGHSTKIAAAALSKNLGVDGVKSVHVCIEPYEMAWLERLISVRVIRATVESVDLDWATELSAGDLLFIDSSHVIRPQGDVLVLFQEIVPKLASGVFVHVHDIFTPRDYLDGWVRDEVKLWNEQYLLEVLLTNSDRYEVVLAANFLRHEVYADLKRTCPNIDNSREPGSFYFRIK